MLGQHGDLSPTLRGLEEDQDLQVMTARDLVTTTTNTSSSSPRLRMRSEGIEAASSAPVTARESNHGGDLPARSLKTIIENRNGAAAAAAALGGGSGGGGGAISSPSPHTTTTIGSTIGSTTTTATDKAAPDKAAVVRRDARPLSVHTTGSIPAAQSLKDYFAAELHPNPIYPIADVVWGQTERDRVYDALLAVPFQLERLLWLGAAICMDSFSAVFTVLPLRVAGAVATLGMCILRSILGSTTTKSSTTTTTTSVSRKNAALRGDQIYDLICAAMFAIAVTFLWRLKAGTIYYWVKDMTQEFLKLSLLHTALELSDKICCSFLVDVLEALAASCTAAAAQPRWSSVHVMNVASDAAVALALILAHGTSLMAQALVFGIAMNSQKKTLLALLIASNFTEIKGTVLKRFDPTKLFILVAQDVVERFHLFIVLAFVLVEELSGAGASTPSARLLGQCGYVLLAEMVIDVVKHAVLCKFNEIRPGVYREFTKDVCEQLATSQSHTAHRLVGFEPFAPAALFFRVVLSYAVLRREDSSGGGGGGASVMKAGMVLVVCWAALAMFKVVLGFLMKRGAVEYLKRYDQLRGRGRGAQGLRSGRVAFAGLSSAGGNSNTAAAAAAAASAQTAGDAVLPTKKDN